MKRAALCILLGVLSYAPAQAETEAREHPDEHTDAHLLEEVVVGRHAPWRTFAGHAAGPGGHPGPGGPDRRRQRRHARCAGLGRAVLQRGARADQRRRHAHPTGESARPAGRQHPGAGQRQAPTPGRGDRRIRRRHQQGRTGGRHCAAGRGGAEARRGAARRRFGAVRVGRHRGGAELRSGERSPPAAAAHAVRFDVRGRRRPDHRLGRHRHAPRRARLRDAQLRAAGQRAHQSGFPGSTGHLPDRERLRRSRGPGGHLGITGCGGRLQGARERGRGSRSGRAVRLRYLVRARRRRQLLLPQSEYPQRRLRRRHGQPAGGRSDARRRRPVSHGAHRRRSGESVRAGGGRGGPELFRVQRVVPERLHAALRRGGQ